MLDKIVCILYTTSTVSRLIVQQYQQQHVDLLFFADHQADGEPW